MNKLKYHVGQVLRLKKGGEVDFSSAKLRDLIEAGDHCTVVKVQRLGNGVEPGPNTPYTVKFLTDWGPRLQGIREKNLEPLPKKRDTVNQLRKRISEALHP